MRLQLEHLSTFDNWDLVPDVKAACEVRDQVRGLLQKRIDMAQTAIPFEKPAATAAKDGKEMQDKPREA